MAPRAVRASRARQLLALLGASLIAGCASLGQLAPKAQQAAETLDCYVAVISPYVGDALDATELIRDAIRGRADLARALVMLGATAADIAAIDDAMTACRPGSAPASPEMAMVE